MKKKTIHLFLLTCLVGVILLGGCFWSEDKTPIPVEEYPQEASPPVVDDSTPAQPESPLEEDTTVPGPIDGVTIDVEQQPAQERSVREYEKVSWDFVNTVTAIMLNLLVNNITVNTQNIEELERIISVLEKAQEKMENDVSPALDELLEARQWLKDLREELFIQPVNFVNLRLTEPQKIGDRYIILSGIWLREARLALRDLERHKKAGANTILITVPLDCDAELNFSTPSKEVMAMYVQAAHASGMRVILSLCQGPPGGYSRGWHDAFFGEQLDVSGKAVLDALTPFVKEWAEFAEEFQVEIFMPVIEPIMWASMDTRYWEMDDLRANEVCNIVSEWMQALLPEIKERYSRKLMFATHNRVTGSSPYFELDFTGYDYIANWETSEEIVTRLSEDCTSTGTCQGLIHHITLYVGGLEFEPANVLTEEEQAIAYNEYFRHTWDNEATAGIMLDLGVGKEYFDRPAEEVIESWLADTPKVSSRSVDVLWSTEGLFEVLDKILSPSEVTYSDEWLEPPSYD